MNSKTPYILKNDEPATTDGLGRDALINSLTEGIKHCETPFVIAINGGWGTGKTSMLKCIKEKIDPTPKGGIAKSIKKKKYPTVWFSPWKFQFEEAPAVSLLQHIRETAVKDKWISLDQWKRDGLKLLNIVGTMAGEMVLKTVTGGTVKTKDIITQGVAFEEKYFEAKQLTTRMNEEFENAIDELTAKDGRLILFIDDLDRCRTENALRLLEALKLFLNAKNCVYVMAVDMENLERHLKTDAKLSNPKEYLDKIFQLVYTLPKPDSAATNTTVLQYLDDNDIFMKKNKDGKEDDRFHVHIQYDLSKFLGNNPRALKGFCNRFRLERAVLMELPSLKEVYKPEEHMFLQILQQCFPSAYRLFHQGNRLIVNRTSKKATRKNFDTFIIEWSGLFDVKETKPREPLIKTLFKNKENDVHELHIIIPEYFSEYFPYIPPLKMDSSSEEGLKFLLVTFRESNEKGIVCIEDHPRNKELEMGQNISEIRDLSNMMLRALNLTNCLLDSCSFEGADLDGTLLSYADFKNSSFINARQDGMISSDAIKDGTKGILEMEQ